MKQIVTTGIVLVRTNFGETDRIITVITPDRGKLRLIAKGVRKTKSRLAGGIELFSVSQLSYIDGKSDIKTLTSSRLQTHFGDIIRDINRTIFGYDVLKIMNKITEDYVDEEYFTLLKNTLEGLNNFDLDIDLLQLWFNLQLLKLSGHTPNLLTDSSGKKLDPSSSYEFNIDTMSFSSLNSGIYNSAHIKLLRLALGLIKPIKLAQIKNRDDATEDSLALSRTMVQLL